MTTPSDGVSRTVTTGGRAVTTIVESRYARVAVLENAGDTGRTGLTVRADQSTASVMLSGTSVAALAGALLNADPGALELLAFEPDFRRRMADAIAATETEYAAVQADNAGTEVSA